MKYIAKVIATIKPHSLDDIRASANPTTGVYLTYVTECIVKPLCRT